MTVVELIAQLSTLNPNAVLVDLMNMPLRTVVSVKHSANTVWCESVVDDEDADFAEDLALAAA